MNCLPSQRKLNFHLHEPSRDFHLVWTKQEVYLKVFGPRSLPVFHQPIRDLRCEQDIRVMTGAPDSG